MKKYISPSYEACELEVNDIMSASSVFAEEEDKENGKVDFVVSPESIFGF